MPVRKKKLGKERKKLKTASKHKRKYSISPIALKDDNVEGVKRLLVPFNTFYKIRPPQPSPKTVMVQSTPKTGLTPKERNYLICSCQRRSSRYAFLKSHAAEAMRMKKIFLMHSPCKAIREALVERGWVEKVPASRMDLSTVRSTKYKDDSQMNLALERLLLSNLVDKAVPNFIWDLKEGYESNIIVQNNKVIYNRLKQSALWTTKRGLCESVRNNYWYYIEGVSEVTCPRTYNTSAEGEKEEFESDYKLTACTSLLKWVLSMAANDLPIFVETGTVSINVLVFALNRCKEYLFVKQNKDIDKPNSHTSVTQWNAFLKKYYTLIAKKDKFKPDVEDKLPLYAEYAKFLLKEIHKYRPQLSCEGCHNIWIIKPANCSRGRGIRLASHLLTLKSLLSKEELVFQKYIEESLLIHETKFDVRQYYLVTKTFPLEIWMYQDCYLKFSSQKYNLKNYHESIHLTNNAVQRKYTNCTDRHPELPQNNMWSLDTFKEYLRKTGREHIWDTIIYPGMKKSITGIMLSCQESTSFWKNRFELYGCDFVLDKNYKPWLIEINCSPDLNPTTDVTANICPAVLSDVIKVVVDRPANSNACTGKFECIFRQNVCALPCRRIDDLIVYGSVLPSEYFYRGNLPTDESSSISTESKQRDIAAVLKRLKSTYLSNKKGEHSTDLDIKNKIKSPHKGSSRPDAIALIIKEKLEEVFKAVPSNDTLMISSPTDPAVSSPSSINFQRDAMKSSEVESLKKCELTNSDENNFNFSKLDDGPLGKGSGLICLNPVEKLDRIMTLRSKTSMTSSNNGENKAVACIETKPQSNKNKSHSKKDQDFLGATKKIFSFLNKKQKEYIHDSFIPDR